MRWRDLQALAACWQLGWSEAREQRLSLLGTAGLYVLVLAIFWAIWGATPLHERQAAPSRASLLWYLAITEWIVFTAGARYREVERDVLSGAIESALLRPVSYGAATLARWSGGCTYQALVLLAVGVVTTWGLTGSGPPHGVLAPLVVLSGALALVLVLLCHLQIGYAAMWLRGAAPVFWVWQKLLFVFGGLLIPLVLYPPLLRRAADASPFAAMLAAPASLMLDGGANLAAVLAAQLAWLAVLGVLAFAIGHWATARLLRVGG
jgi:viologen exporter family transport system permease protein